jgi:hypothetical protein
MGVGMRRLKPLLNGILLLGAAACSATDPTPSSLYDGQYAGTRQSDQAEACGIASLRGTTSARIAGGRLTMGLFSPKTRMTGTVGDDGTVRASGIWSNPTGGFPGMTLLNGKISGNELSGTATDFRCRTDVRLRRVEPPPGRPNTARKARP